ncbi:MAG: hypothetical protein WED87_00845, partial [Dehalococcoidia bacterium]
MNIPSSGVVPLLGLLLLPVPAAAQTQGIEGDPAPAPTAAYVANHADMPVVRAVRLGRSGIDVDGLLTEEVWASASPATGFIQLDPDEGQVETNRTEVRVVYDDDALYLGAMMYQEEPLSTRLGRRDGGQMDADYIAVILDSYHDHLAGYRFRVTPSGVRRDEV